MKENKWLEELPVLSTRAYNALRIIVERSNKPPEPGWPSSFSAPINNKADLMRELVNGNVAKARYVGSKTYRDLCHLAGVDPEQIKGKRLCPTCGTLV